MSALTSVDAQPRAGRAAPMSPPERRAAIVEATLPLIRCHGLAVTTRQIAEAAGIAEGTIFGVFADKEEVLAASVAAIFDPTPVAERLGQVSLELGLVDRLVEAVTIIQQYLSGIWPVLSDPDSGITLTNRRGKRPTVLTSALTPLFEPEADHLRRTPAASAHALTAMTFAESHPAVVGDTPTPPQEIVTLLLDGLRETAEKNR